MLLHFKHAQRLRRRRGPEELETPRPMKAHKTHTHMNADKAAYAVAFPWQAHALSAQHERNRLVNANTQVALHMCCAIRHFVGCPALPDALSILCTYTLRVGDKLATCKCDSTVTSHSNVTYGGEPCGGPATGIPTGNTQLIGNKRRAISIPAATGYLPKRFTFTWLELLCLRENTARG